jgi:hypothetical protein
MYKCALPDCHNQAKSSCSSCGREQYCSGNCQKLDWKLHKSMCPILKKLSNKFQTYPEALQVIDDTLGSKKGNVIRVLEHLYSYAEFQVGKQCVGVGFLKRVDGDGIRMSHKDADIGVLHRINVSIVDAHDNNSISCLVRDNNLYPYLERSICLLNPWLVHLDTLSASNRIEMGFNNDKINHLIQQLYLTEKRMALVTMNRLQFSLSEGHCQRCLAFSKRFGIEGDNKTTMVFGALQYYCDLRQQQADFLSAVTFAEEGYNLVVTQHDPVNPEVQDAAGQLIQCLISTGNLFDSER